MWNTFRLTCQLQFYSALLLQGEIENMGSYQELSKSEQEFSMLLTNLEEKVVPDKVSNLKSSPLLVLRMSKQ